MQVKTPIKINKYHLKSLQDTYSKKCLRRTYVKLSTSKQKKKKFKTVSNLFRDSTHLDSISCGDQSAEFR